MIISLSSLPSRAAHLSATGGTGLRTIATRAASNTTSSGGSITGLFSGAFAFGASIVAKAFKLIAGGIQLSFTALFGFIVRGIGFIWNFNWNVTDSALDAQLTSAYTALAGSVGGTLGNALGYLVCGAAPAALISTVNEPLALAVLLNLGEEALDEVAGNVAEVIKLTAKSIAQTAVVHIFKNVRSVLRPDGAKLRQKLMAGGKLSQAQIDKAVEERNKPWSFAIALDNFVEETFPNEIIQEGVEEFFDEFSGACVESGYIIAQTLDTYYPTFFNGINAALGGTTTISITP